MTVIDGSAGREWWPRLRRFLDLGRLAALGVLALCLVVRLIDPPPVEFLRLRTFDLFQRLDPRESRDSPVVVVDIDEASLAVHGQWPWPRTLVADLVTRLSAMSALVIGFDMVLSEADRTSPQWVGKVVRELPEDIRARLKSLPDHDAVLARTLFGAPVVLGQIAGQQKIGPGPLRTTVSFGEAGADPRPYLLSYKDATRNLPELEQQARGLGMLNVYPESDGVVRRIPGVVVIRDQLYPSLAIEMLRVALGEKSVMVMAEKGVGVRGLAIKGAMVRTDEAGRIWVHHARSRLENYVSARDVLAGAIPAKEIAGKFVLIGTSAAGLHDIWPTPLENAVPGVEMHAQMLETIITNTFVDRPHNGLDRELTFTAVVGLLIISLLPFANPRWTLPALVAVVAAVAGGALAAFFQGRVLYDPSFPILSFVLLYVGLTYLSFLRLERQRRRIRHAFARYLTPTLLDHLIATPKALNLEGEPRHVTFLFTDIAGFTALVEKLHPKLLVEVLNDYLEGLCAIALKHEGTLDKIVGDSIHAMFNAPADQPDHAQRAVACALEMDRFAQAFAKEKRGHDIPFGMTRIGINTGWVTVGNFGGQSRFDYTAHGDPINVAARLESVNKHLGTRVCVSEATANHAPDVAFRPVGTLVLKGKTEGIAVFEPLHPDEAASPRIEAYRTAFTLMEEGNQAAFATLADLRERFPDDPLIRFHLERLEAGEIGATVVMRDK